MKTRTSAQFRDWANAHKAMATTVCRAMAFAQVERERVNKYVLPIFQTFQFVDENGEPIARPGDLSLCHDEAMCKAFYDQCNAEHRAHGWNCPEGHCPALTAETLLMTAENAFLKAGCEFVDVNPWLLHGDKRTKMLDLLLKACLSA